MPFTVPDKSASDHSELIVSRTTCIVGGGSSAHVLVAFLARQHRVHLLTRRPQDWHDVVFCEQTEGDTGKIVSTHCGAIDKVSSDPQDVIPDADFIILCMPVASYRHALHRIAPHLHPSKDVFVGTIYGQAGFNWMVEEIKKEFSLQNNVITFAMGQIPWICRTVEYGQSVKNFGGKHINTVAVSPPQKFDKLNLQLLEDVSLHPIGTGKFQQVDFLSITLSVDNQIIHPSRCYGLWSISGGTWESEAAVPMFYRDFDQGSAHNIQELDAEYEQIRKAIQNRFPERKFQMLSYMELEKLNHNSCHPDILASFRHSKQLASIQTPTLVGHHGSRVLNTKCRFFTDDIPYGLLIAKWLAEQLYIRTPLIDKIILWAQNIRNEQFLTPEGHIHRSYCLKDKFRCGIPEAYGMIKLEEVLDRE